MLNSRIAIVIGLGISLGLINNPVAAAQDGSAVVAEVGNHKITAEELQEKEAGKLLQARYKYYLAERDALDQLVEEQLLETQAKREGVSVDELLKRHVTVQVAEPTEDQLKFYYEGLGSDESYDAVRGKILETVHQIRFTKARTVYIDSLRSQLGVVVMLTQPSAKVDVTNAYRQGPPNAPVQLVEFADYECPYCQKVHVELALLRAQYGDKVSVVYKDLPLPMHASAEKAAEAARCAGVQGKFWEFHDSLFETKKLQIPDLKQEARTLNLDAARFDKCLDSGEQAALVQKDLIEGKHLGLTGTPSFFANGHFLSGAIAYAKLRETVDEELAAKASQKPAVAASTVGNQLQK
jgi:protein-disulfide isomerase